MAVTQKVSVTVRFSKSGLQPPVFLAGSFSDWQPQEMHHILSEHNEHEYYRQVEVESGKEYQYKFRIGEGDWWVLDEGSQIATDNIGNRNNLLVVPIHEEPLKTTESEAANMPSLDEANKEPAATLHHIHEPTTISDVASSILPDALSPVKDTKDKEEDRKPCNVDGPTASPLLVVNNNSEQHHTTDIKEDLSDGAKDEQLLKTRAAEPDYVVVRSENRTPDIARSAAEVAESAASLDRGAPTPPISDEEAGRIGFRRMSQTPIPEVANVAAEVADTAAILDKEDCNFKIEIPPPTIDIEGPGTPEEGSGTVTPWEDRAPRFSHECPELPSGELRPASRENYENSGPRDPFENSPVDLNDPSLEEFPSSREAIYEQVRSCQRRLSEDQVSVEGIPPSPVVAANHYPERLDLPTPSPNMLSKSEERSPSLDSIPEEQNYREELLTALPKAMNAPRSHPDSEGVGQSSDEGQGISRADSNEAVATFTPSESDDPSHSDEAEDGGSSSNYDHSSASDAIAENKNQPGQKRDTVNIVLAPRGSSLENMEGEPVDTAKGTALEVENGRLQLKSRKHSSPAADRPITPNSVRSASKDANSKNFLKAFLRLIFVDWVGGFIKRLCGGGRRTLVAITALVIIGLAPALYFSV